MEYSQNRRKLFSAKTRTLFLAFSRAAQCHSMVMCHDILARVGATHLNTRHKNGKR